MHARVPRHAGYFEDPRATAEAVDADGWLHTGDLCSMDDRGFCAIEGRLKDMMIRGGEKIYPREIEQLLFSHPAVADVAVVGVPDPTWGEHVAVFVRPAAGQTPTGEELFASCRQHLSPHKAPRYWQFVEEFPIRERVAPPSEIIGGDLFASVPSGGDVYILMQVNPQLERRRGHRNPFGTARTHWQLAASWFCWCRSSSAALPRAPTRSLKRP